MRREQVSNWPARDVTRDYHNSAATRDMEIGWRDMTWPAGAILIVAAVIAVTFAAAPRAQTSAMPQPDPIPTAAANRDPVEAAAAAPKTESPASANQPISPAEAETPPSNEEPPTDPPLDQPAATEDPLITAPSPKPVRRQARPVRSAERIVAELLTAEELGLHTFGKSQLDLALPTGHEHPALELFDGRDGLGRFPLARADKCRLGPNEAAALGLASRQLKSAFFLTISVATGSAQAAPASVAERLALIGRAAELRPDLLALMTGGEGEAARQLVIEALASACSAGSVQVLATRAVFDPSPQLRRLAALALRGKPHEPARPVLMAALQYPWPAAADHAADALITAGDRGAGADLVRLLDYHDPAQPLTDDDGYPMVREVVRVNHARNCQLCHAPSFDTRDPVHSSVPSPDQPLTSPLSAPGGSYGSGSQRRPPTPVGFVRADTTYLRPDFSTLLPVPNPGAWPVLQRYDFVVRTRPARPVDLAAADMQTSPQRGAVLRVLRGLTKADYGDRAEDWRAALRDNQTLAVMLALAAGR
jgi:hypothetical protein